VDPLPIPGRPGRIEELFAELADLAPAERSRRLDERGADPQLRRDLETLLDADTRPSVLDAISDVIAARAGRTARAAPAARADSVAHTARADSTAHIAAPLEPGRVPRPEVSGVISHYRLLEPLGEGGAGVVFRARDDRLQRDVALKLVRSSAVESGEAGRRVLEEARAAATLDHPNICPIYDIGETADGLFIAMAYCDGGTLADRLQRGPLPAGEALEILRQLTAALAAAHGAGIVHCDVKPSNIMLTGAGAVRLVDFGISRRASASDTDARIRGTLAYMAPEQLRGEPADARADVWAAGVVLYECLTGTHPFRAVSDAVTVQRILDGTPARAAADVIGSRALLDVLERCLARRREDRYPDAAILHETILTLLATRGTTDAGARRHREVPLAPTRLIGRDHELERLDAVLTSSRLVTVTGTGGTGKTHLALTIAEQLAARFEAGAVFVSLAAVADPSLVASAIAESLGLVDRPAQPPAQLLCDFIGDSNLLLVIDNFEQVAGAAPLLSELLARCVELRILVTSRRVLRLRGEAEFVLGPLPLPPAGIGHDVAGIEAYAAVALFLERARAVRPDLALDEDDIRTIVAICRQLDGLPLAIELAAAQMRVFPPSELMVRLTRPLDALAHGARDMPHRHRTLRDAIAWSYSLLGPDEQAVFRRAGVFAGGVDLDGLAQVCEGRPDTGGVAAAALTLAEHSLVRAVTGVRGSARVAVLETVREYAREALAAAGEEPAVRRSHAQYFMHLAEAGALALGGADQAYWLYRLEQEHDNLRTALDWAEQAGEAETALRTSAALCRFWTVRGHVREGLERLHRLRRMSVDDSLLARRAAVIAGAGSLVHETGDYRAAQPLLEEALAQFRTLDDDASVARVLNTLAWTHAHTGPLHEAAQIAEDALSACQRRGDRRATAVALHNMAWIAVYRGAHRCAIAYAAAAIAIREQLGDRRGAAFTLANRARAERQAGDFAAADDTLRQALAVTDVLADQQLLGLVRMAEGQVRLEQGATEEAAASLRTALGIWHDVRHDFAAGDCLNWLAAATMQLGRPSDAAALLDRADAIWGRIGGPWGLAATLYRRGQLALRTGQAGAVDLLERSLDLRRGISDLIGAAECCAELAGCEPILPPHLRAAELRAEVERLRLLMNEPPRHTPSEPMPSEPMPSEPMPSEPIPSEPIPSDPASSAHASSDPAR
jgi:predicted ATPase/serine/threonine protein kinase